MQIWLVYLQEGEIWVRTCKQGERHVKMKAETEMPQ